MPGRNASSPGEAAIRRIVKDAPEFRPGRRRRRQSGGEESGPPQRDLLIGLTADLELWHSPDREAFASVPITVQGQPDGEFRANWPVRSRDFKLWLTGRFYAIHNGSPGGQAVEDALRVIEARAIHEGHRHEVFLRVGELPGRVFLDLGDETWRAVEVSATGWRVIDTPACKFLRSQAMRPLPVPMPGGLIEGLRNFVNVETDADFRLVTAWLVGTLRPKGPYPVLIVNGEQGSAKSTLCRLLRALIDPNAAPIRAAPRDDRDLLVSALNSWVLSLDNLSDIAAWLSDALCRLATGGGFATRELYSDRGEVIFEAQRPILINSIPDLASRPDLGDRALAVTLPTIPENQRRPESEFWREFEAARPELLGALLDAVCSALREGASTELDHLPRMADFAHWVTAAEPGLGWPSGRFLADYRATRDRTVFAALEADPVAVAVRQLIDPHPWEGTAAELLGELDRLVSEGIRRSRSWPHLPHVLSGRLRRLAPTLRAVGIEVATERIGKERIRTISIRRIWNPTQSSGDDI